MSSLAQEESRSISENTTWGRRKAFADGNYSLPWKNFYGYDKGENGKPVINEKQAEVIRLIYKMFLEGYSAQAIETNFTHAALRVQWAKTSGTDTTSCTFCKMRKCAATPCCRRNTQSRS